MLKITECVDFIHSCEDVMKSTHPDDPLFVCTVMNNFLGYMDYLSELHRLLYD